MVSFHFVFNFRLKHYNNFKEGQSKILVATDLVGREIETERVNIAMNYDMPESADTYLQRVFVKVVHLVCCSCTCYCCWFLVGMSLRIVCSLDFCFINFLSGGTS